MSKLNKKIDTMFFGHQKKVKNKNALGVPFLQAKNTRAQLATHVPTLHSPPPPGIKWSAPNSYLVGIAICVDIGINLCCRQYESLRMFQYVFYKCY